MNIFAKLLRGEPTKRTRFHTRRGVLMPKSAWLALPSTILQGVGVWPSVGPWMAPAAVARLDALIEPSWVVLEFGAGRSTAWYARRSTKVTSVEDSRSWLQLVRQELAEKGLCNCELELLEPEEYPTFVDKLEDGSLDLVVVDSAERAPGDRLRWVAAAMTKVRPGRFLVLDDSDRPSYGGADRILSGWAVERFIGLKSSPFAATETSIYRRPADLES